MPDALAFKSINDPIKNQINSCAAICVKQDDPCHLLRVLYESLITGGLAGVVVEAALYPIDTIKTRVQVVSPQISLCYNFSESPTITNG
ncbi:SAMC2 [Arabidopsis thaliana]|uniref:SAMC2 n=1 Tax=Arabidopsis thaliana TaxID=3702 RepID=A0A178WFB4_ARATH|nr:SAMC2 [Arabidopsis thaliana]